MDESKSINESPDLAGLGTQSIACGLSGALFLFFLYFLILTLANSFSHAIEQFRLFWYWLVILAIGFGLQTGLYAYIRLKIREKKVKSAAKEMAVSGGVSTA